MSLPEIIEISNRRKIGAIAQQLLDGRVSVVGAAQQIARLRHAAGLGDERDRDVGLFVGIDDETDHLPTGSARDYWAADVLARKDAEIAEAEAFHHEPALEAARRLVSRYAREEIPPSAYDWYVPNDT